MKPSTQIAWAQHWKEKGVELRYHAGRLHYLDGDCETEVPTWLDVHGYFMGLDNAQCKRLDDLLTDYACERYCPQCKTYNEPEDMHNDPSDVEDILCESCLEESNDDREYTALGPMTYYGLKESDF